MRPTDFATQLARFFADHLAAQRNVRPNTIRAYRDTFLLFLRFCRDLGKEIAGILLLPQETGWMERRPDLLSKVLEAVRREG